MGQTPMLGFYIICTIAGGVLVLMNVFAGGHGHDFDTDTDIDLDHGGHGSVGHGAWIPFFSVRFWTYFAITTGLAGLLLTQLTGVREPTVAILAISTGFVLGLVVALSIRILSRYDSNSSAKVDDLLGMEALVLVAVRPLEPGKIRCHLKGDTLDMLALSQDESVHEPGSSVVIVAIEKDRAMVVPRAVLYG